jgi:hypothetical protein
MGRNEGKRDSESPPDFSGKSGNRDKAHLEILGLVVDYAWEDGTPPRRPSREGTQAFRTIYGIYRIRNFVR